MKENSYEIEKNIEKIYRESYTGFLTSNIQKELTKRLKKNSFKIFLPYPEADKVIFYQTKIPEVKLFKIITTSELKHSSILGSLFSLNIHHEVFGDIIKYDGYFYIYLLKDIVDYVTQEFKQVGHAKITLQEVPLEYLENYHRQYETKELIISSLRIDTLLARLIGTSRDQIKTIIKDKKVLINYEIATKPEYQIKIGDIFSIKGHGKYRFTTVVGTTKKNNYIIKLDKYQ